MIFFQGAKVGAGFAMIIVDRPQIIRQKGPYNLPVPHSLAIRCNYSFTFSS